MELARDLSLHVGREHLYESSLLSLLDVCGRRVSAPLRDRFSEGKYPYEMSDAATSLESSSAPEDDSTHCPEAQDEASRSIEDCRRLCFLARGCNEYRAFPNKLFFMSTGYGGCYDDRGGYDRY